MSICLSARSWIIEAVVAAGIFFSEFHKRPSDAWITMYEIEQTQAFANSAFSKSPKSFELLQNGLDELVKRNVIRQHTRDFTLMKWMRPSHRHQFALCADDAAVKDVLARANANLMETVAAVLRKEAAETAKVAAESAKADADLLEAQKRLAALTRKKKPVMSRKKKPASRPL